MKMNTNLRCRPYKQFKAKPYSVMLAIQVLMTSQFVITGQELEVLILELGERSFPAMENLSSIQSLLEEGG